MYSLNIKSSILKRELIISFPLALSVQLSMTTSPRPGNSICVVSDPARRAGAYQQIIGLIKRGGAREGEGGLVSRPREQL